eukprot:CAMPEP_0194029876 /NCGR_PEP_ID=MMETSP0009_2-20130614/3506_1 /TAXON_ID=210454 /ORGANISM="Grammatophora oceanica, Strain CCMP 410" /LENGTH=66 /DNA_ID=CAMNT_0038669675 /DNA_START=420 /DNA_END=620 /DNA_ORIENTATION=-
MVVIMVKGADGMEGRKMHVGRKNSLREVMVDRCDEWMDGWMDGSSSLNSGRSGEVVVVVVPDLDAR